MYIIELFYINKLKCFLFEMLPGRLYQVEYAMEAIGHAGTCLGILASDGVLLALFKCTY